MELKLWKTLNLVKKAPYTRGVIPYKKNGDVHHTFRGGPLKKLMGGRVGGTFSANFNIGIFFAITVSTAIRPY